MAKTPSLPPSPPPESTNEPFASADEDEDEKGGGAEPVAAAQSFSDDAYPSLPIFGEDDAKKLTWGSATLCHVLLEFVLLINVKAALAFEDKEDAMAFYGVYHRHPANQAVHFLGVPCLLWSVFVLGSHLPIVVPPKSFGFGVGGGGVLLSRLPFCPPHYASWATLYLLFYAAFYFAIDYIGASLYFPVLYASYVSAVRMTRRDQRAAAVAAAAAAAGGGAKAISTAATGKQQKQRQKGSTAPPVPWTGTGSPLRVAFWVHVASWSSQIHLGHKVFEGAQPAVLQSLGGALTSAPLFAFYEGVWALGFRRDFRASVMQKVDQYTRELCESGTVSMRACDGLVPKETEPLSSETNDSSTPSTGTEPAVADSGDGTSDEDDNRRAEMQQEEAVEVDEDLEGYNEAAEEEEEEEVQEESRTEDGNVAAEEESDNSDPAPEL